MISLQLYTSVNHWINHQHTNHVSMMTRYCTRGHIPRPPYPRRTKRSSLRHNPVYCIRSIFLFRILLSFLPLQSSPNSRIGRLLTPSRYYPSKSTRSPTPKHISPSGLWSLYYLSSSQSNRRKPQAYNSSTINYDLLRFIFHRSTSIRILRNIFYNLRWRLWIYFLYSYRLSRPSCNHWIYFPYRVPSSTTKISFHFQSSLRI